MVACLLLSYFVMLLCRVEKGLQYAYRNRKLKSRNARKEWIMQINAGLLNSSLAFVKSSTTFCGYIGARIHHLQYGQFMHTMKVLNIGLNRKMLANFAHSEPLTFAGICHFARIQEHIKPKSSFIF